MERLPSDEEWEEIIRQEMDPFAGDDMPTGTRRFLNDLIDPDSPFYGDDEDEDVSPEVSRCLSFTQDPGRMHLFHGGLPQVHHVQP
jgi:hypothetical protein